MVKRSPLYAVTLIELMITLMIVAIVLSTAFITMRGYIPRQRLVSTTGILQNLIQQAQSEANARSYWTCIKFSGSPTQAQIWVDADSTHSTAGNTCGAGTDIPLNKFTFKNAVSLPSCSENITPSCVLWFDTTGVPKICFGDTGCGTSADTAVGGLASGVCADRTYQIVLSSSDLDSPAKAREIEVLAGGIVRMPKPDEKGLGSPAFWANSPVNSGGCE